MRQGHVRGARLRPDFPVTKCSSHQGRAQTDIAHQDATIGVLVSFQLTIVAALDGNRPLNGKYDERVAQTKRCRPCGVLRHSEIPRYSWRTRVVGGGTHRLEKSRFVVCLVFDQDERPNRQMLQFSNLSLGNVFQRLLINLDTLEPW